MDLDNYNDGDWGPWQKGSEVYSDIKIGDIFILSTYEPNGKEIYKLNTYDLSKNLSCYIRSFKKWDDSHGYNISRSDCFIRLLKSQPKAEVKCDGCFCKKCKNYSFYAAPNQSDNTFICYSCR